MATCAICGEEIEVNPCASCSCCLKPVAPMVHIIEYEDGVTRDDDHEAQSYGEYL